MSVFPFVSVPLPVSVSAFVPVFASVSVSVSVVASVSMIVLVPLSVPMSLIVPMSFPILSVQFVPSVSGFLVVSVFEFVSVRVPAVSAEGVVERELEHMAPSHRHVRLAQ